MISSAAKADPGDSKSIKVLSWNVQFMAGKNYCFFYDRLDGKGPHWRPSGDDIQVTIREVARVIREERPDVLLLQELDDGARRTDYQDQLRRLLELLPSEYAWSTEAFYWKARFVPHPKIWGSAGMKLATISRHPIQQAWRHQLALTPKDPLTQLFYLKRCVLESRISIGNKTFTAMNTHLEAFAQGTNTLERQVRQVSSLLNREETADRPWVIGGDFNLLPPVQRKSSLHEHQQGHYNDASELAPLYEKFQAVPSLKDLSGPDASRWFTYFPNDPRVGKPDRTIDYVFFGRKLALSKSYVRAHDTLRISDHLPVIAEFQVF